MIGRLHLIPTPLGRGALSSPATPPDVLRLLSSLDGIIAESKKSALAFSWKRINESANQRLAAAEIKTNYELKYESAGREIYYLELQK